MPFNKALSGYTLVHQTLEAAKRAGGARLSFPTQGSATQWRAKAYYYRARLADHDQRAHSLIPGYIGTTPFDTMMLTADPEDKAIVLITFDVPPGELVSLDGKKLSLKPIEFAPASPAAVASAGAAIPADSPELLEALQLAAEKGDD